MMLLIHLLFRGGQQNNSSEVDHPFIARRSTQLETLLFGIHGLPDLRVFKRDFLPDAVDVLPLVQHHVRRDVSRRYRTASYSSSWGTLVDDEALRKACGIFFNSLWCNPLAAAESVAPVLCTNGDCRGITDLNATRTDF